MNNSAVFVLALLFGYLVSPSEQISAYPYPLKLDEIKEPMVSPEWCPPKDDDSCEEEGETVYALVGCCCNPSKTPTDYFKFDCIDGEWVEDRSQERYDCPFYCEY